MLIPIISSSKTGKFTCFVDPFEVALIGIDEKGGPYILLKQSEKVIYLQSSIDVEELAKTINKEYIAR